MRDYKNIDAYLDRLINDIYPQPQDKRHTEWAKDAIEYFLYFVGKDISSVLDLGCGEGFCQDLFEGKEYLGVAWGEDVVKARENGKNVTEADFSFLGGVDGVFDLLFSRHSLEHSPFPLLTLMEWHRVSKRYLAVVLPDPAFWLYVGRNHYYVLNVEQWENLFDVAGWKIITCTKKSAIMSEEENAQPVDIEFWYLLEKK